MEQINVITVKTAKENRERVNSVCKSANKELKDVFTNAFVLCNTLNKVVSGKVGDGLLSGTNINVDSLREMAKLLKEYHRQRYAFNVDVLPKDRFGRFCMPAKMRGVPAHDFDMIALNSKCVATYLRPIELGVSINAFVSYFSSLLRTDAREKLESARAKELAAKHTANMDKMRKVVGGVFGEFANAFTDAQIREKYELIKSA